MLVHECLVGAAETAATPKLLRGGRVKTPNINN